MIALPKTLRAHAFTLVVTAVFVFVSARFGFAVWQAHQAYIDVQGTSAIMDYDRIYSAKRLFFKDLDSMSALCAVGLVSIFSAAIALLGGFSAPRARVAICVASSLVLLTFGHVSVKPWHHELAHYYTHETYSGGICGRSVVRWLHRLDGNYRDPATAIQSKGARQYFYGPHAFQRGEGRSPLD